MASSRNAINISIDENHEILIPGGMCFVPAIIALDACKPPECEMDLLPPHLVQKAFLSEPSSASSQIYICTKNIDSLFKSEFVQVSHQ